MITKRLHLFALLALAQAPGFLLLAPSTALAQATPAPAPAPDVAPSDPPLPRTWDESRGETEAKAETPAEPREPGHSGFAMAFSVGYAVPTGNTTGAPNDGLSSTFSGQVPLTLELGGNATPSFFIGVYGTFAPGGLAGSTASTCTTYQLDCSANSVHGGLALRYRFFPGESFEPWIGYGIGYESNSFSASSPQTGATASGTVTGWEFGHFSAGLDFLLARMFAFGPFLDVAVGQYDHMHLEGTNEATEDGSIASTSLHEWITIGVRSVIMP